MVGEGVTRKVLGFRVMTTLGEREGNGSRTKREGSVVKRVMVAPREEGKCQQN